MGALETKLFLTGAYFAVLYGVKDYTLLSVKISTHLSKRLLKSMIEHKEIKIK